MGGYGFFRDANAATLKPELLRGILNEKVLDAKRPFGKSSELVEKFKPIVDMVAVHRLLSESVPESPDSEIVASYKSAVDDWIDRILKLLAGDLKLAFCLALLPKTRGDEDFMLKRVLVSINLLLDDALEGLDGGESKRREVFSVLLPPGSSLPPLGEVSNTAASRSRPLLMRIVSTLMQCFCMMLLGLYPVQVAVPVHSVLATIKKVLMVYGSVHPSLEPITTPVQQEDVCAQLPVLHQYSLELLTPVVTGIHSQLVPYAADIARLLIWYLKKYTFPETRVQVYSIIPSLLVSMGAGMTLYFAEEVFMNASIDLNPNDSSERDTSEVTALASAEPALQHCNKKKEAWQWYYTIR